MKRMKIILDPRRGLATVETEGNTGPDSHWEWEVCEGALQYAGMWIVRNSPQGLCAFYTWAEAAADMLEHIAAELRESGTVKP